MLGKFSATIDAIYGAALGREPWEQALHSVEELTGCVGAVIGFVPKSQSHVAFNLAGRFTAEQCATYSEHYQPICRRTRYMVDHAALDVVYDSLLITEQEMNKDPVYDWFGKHGLRYFAGAALPPTHSHLAVLSLQRSPAQGHVQAADIDLFKQVKLHVGRAITLADQVGTLRNFERISNAIFETLPHALFAIDADGRIVFANGAAAQLLRDADGLKVANGRLLAAGRDEQAGFDALLSSAGEGGNIRGAGWTKVSRPSGKPPYAAFVAPLKMGDDQFAQTAKALVIVHNPSARGTVDGNMLTCLFGLTGTEARLASALALGHSVDSAAASLGMQVGTARSHLKSIFIKLGVNRQQDLVGLLTSLSSIRP